MLEFVALSHYPYSDAVCTCAVMANVPDSDIEVNVFEFQSC